MPYCAYCSFKIVPAGSPAKSITQTPWLAMVFAHAQEMFDCDVLAFNTAGSPTVAKLEAVQPFASVTVSPYVAAHRFVFNAALPPLLQSKSSGSCPPLTVHSAAPSHNPLHDASVILKLKLIEVETVRLVVTTLS